MRKEKTDRQKVVRKAVRTKVEDISVTFLIPFILDGKQSNLG